MSPSHRRALIGVAALAASLVVTPAASAGFALGPPVGYSVGGEGAATLAVTDFNGDRLPDVATGNAGSGDVSVLLGTPGGGFGPAKRYPVGGGATLRMVVADVNLDRRGDIAYVASGTDGVGVLYGDGKGGFASPVTYPEQGDGPSFLAVGDLNDDGLPDFAVSNGGSGDMRVLFQQADGTFKSPPPFVPGDFPSSLAIGDLNRDGLNDLAVSTDEGVTRFIASPGGGLGTLQGPPTTFPTEIPLVPIEIADLNRDGINDIVGSTRTPRGVTVLIGATNGGYLEPKTYSAGGFPSDVAVRDMNGDGRPDLVVPAYDSPFNHVAVLLARRGGGFAAPYERRVPGFAGPVGIADVYRDGRPDVLVANGDAQTLMVLANTSTPTARLSTTALRFGRHVVGSRSGSRAITVTNAGAARLRISSLRLVGPDADEFRISGDGCTGEAIAPGRACRLGIRFAPVAPAPARAVLRIRSNDPKSPSLVGLRGTGTLAP